MIDSTTIIYELSTIIWIGGLAQLARAPALHAGGQRFESVILHFIDLWIMIYELWVVEFRNQKSEIINQKTIYDILNKAKSNIF